MARSREAWAPLRADAEKDYKQVLEAGDVPSAYLRDQLILLPKNSEDAFWGDWPTAKVFVGPQANSQSESKKRHNAQQVNLPSVLHAYKFFSLAAVVSCSNGGWLVVKRLSIKLLDVSFHFLISEKMDAVPERDVHSTGDAVEQAFQAVKSKYAFSCKFGASSSGDFGNVGCEANVAHVPPDQFLSALHRQSFQFYSTEENPEYALHIFLHCIR